MAVSFVREHLLPLLKPLADELLLSRLRNVKNVVGDATKELAEFKDELEIIQDLINDEERRAAVAEEGNTRDRIKRRVRQLREAAFRIEDLIDECQIYEEQSYDPRFAALPYPYETADYVKTQILRLRIAYNIQYAESYDEEIESLVREIKERRRNNASQIQSNSEQGSSNSTGSLDVTWQNLRLTSRYVKEDDVVGFEAQKSKLIGWLTDPEGRKEELTVISVVGMGGLGKTTLASIVFYNQNVIGHFYCHAWITVSQSYTVDGLLREMLQKFYEDQGKAPPQDISKMAGVTLIDKVRDYLQQNRYVVVFDDVWDKKFWDKIKCAVVDDKNGSRVLITTRDMDVVECCKKYSTVEVHEMQRLSREKSLELFCKMAFRSHPGGCCPEEFKDISSKIVAKCDDLPLAIVIIGCLLCSDKLKKTTIEWGKFCDRLGPELDNNPDLTDITRILDISYDDLPDHLKSCLLYFGIYPEDCEVKSAILIRQWIAEGFVKSDEMGRTLEEVAKQYLTELIHRSLVQVSSFSFDGEAKSCRVHDVLREMILGKFKDLSFCQFVSEDDQSVFSGIIRRLTIATNSNNLMGTIQSAHVRSLHIFRREELPEDFVRIIATKYRLLKVLDFEHTPLNYVPQNLGSLFHLRYLSFRTTNVESLPNSIGNLQNLETLDLRQTHVRKMPREINKLGKLRHLLASHMSWHFGDGIQMMDGIGGLVSLQTLRQVETDHNGVKLIEELGKLSQLRVLGLIHFKREYGSVLCSSIDEMKQLEKLYIDAISPDQVIDLHCISSSSLPVLKLHLRGKLERLTEWIPKFQNLAKLSLISSKLTNDSLESLKHMENLLFFSLDSAYADERLHFEDGGFRKLKQLSLRHLYGLNSIHIGEGALPSLKEFVLVFILDLKKVPSGIHHLGKLEVFHIINMPEEFRESIREDRWINKHVPLVNITDSVRQNYLDRETPFIRDSRH